MSGGAPTTARDAVRQSALSRGVRLEGLTIGYNVVEAVIAFAAAWMAQSVALLGFGFDSVVELMSGGVLFWRLRREQHGVSIEDLERIEHRAQRLVAISLVFLGTVVGVEAIRTLVVGRHPQTSWIGVGLTSVSVVVMFVLARAKQRTARRLGSRAMEGDAFHTDACFWISLVVLVGLGLNIWQGWWWADPAGALAIIPFLGMEARELWSWDAE